MAKRLSLKLRILFLSSAVLLLAMLFAGGIILHNAQEAVKAEHRVAKRLVMMLADRSGMRSPQAVRTEIQAVLHKHRHVRVILEPTTNVRDRVADTQEQIPNVPAWFVRLMYPEHPILHQVRDSAATGPIVIEADPTDEIREVWEEVRQLSLSGAGVFVLVGALLYITLWFGLRPLDNLLVAFKRLEREDFDVRLNEGEVLEIACINRKFNQLAEVLEQSKADNRLLTTKLVNMRRKKSAGRWRGNYTMKWRPCFSISMCKFTPQRSARCWEMEKKKQALTCNGSMRPQASCSSGFDFCCASCAQSNWMNVLSKTH